MSTNFFPASKLPFACTAFIRSQLDKYLPLINADIATELKSVKPTPQFADRSKIGELPVTGTPYMTVCMASDMSKLTSGRMVGGTNHFTASMTFHVKALIPLAGDNTATNYEVMLQAAAGYTMSWLRDSAQSLTPLVWLASIPDIAVMAQSGVPGNLVTIFPFTQADRTTVQRGFLVPYTLSFDVAGEYATTVFPKSNAIAPG